jgi:secreted trypsin-like serine protease
MRKLTLAAVAAVLLASTAPVMTVTNGRPDGNGHPYVGIALQAAPGGGFFVCSGSFISPTRFLTAAHCFDPSAPALVSPANQPPFPVVPGVVHNDPNWCIGCGSGLPGFDTHDVAVIELAAAVFLPVYAALPAPGLVDTLAMMTPVDIVGYGVQGFIRGGGQPEDIFTAIRFFAPSELVQSNNRASGEFIKLTANPSQGTGGVCFGDSGGPDVLGGTNIVLAVNSYVTNGNCSGVTYSQRVDLPDILAFINSI